jgi:hypothetical protein
VFGKGGNTCPKWPTLAVYVRARARQRLDDALLSSGTSGAAMGAVRRLASSGLAPTLWKHSGTIGCLGA